MKQTKVNVLLGAGFSYDAGIPLVQDINPYFDRDFLDKLCFFSDSQWRWKEFQNDANKHNGRLSVEVEIVEFVFNHLVHSMKREKGSFSSYEIFMTYLIDKGKDWFSSQVVQAKEAERSLRISRQRRMPNSKYWSKYDDIDLPLVLDIINYLIADLLRTDKFKPIDEIESYDKFLAYISVYNQVNFFSLNHDLLLEEVLRKRAIRYSDGFTRENSEIIGNQKQPLAVFKSDYSAPYKIMKLHGGKDQFAYQIAEKEDHMNYLTGERIYFRIDDYYDLHRSARIDLSTGDIIQNFNHSVVPQFLTGSLKQTFLENDYMYSDLLTRYRNELIDDSDLLIIGYSYQDKHIDEVLQKVDPKRIVNVNPGDLYPYGDARNLKYMTDL
ncbi:MAG: SIR2 family protein [Cytophagales bacterium]|nr:SIR2 family protein [Cytophagales bacterium]